MKKIIYILILYFLFPIISNAVSNVNYDITKFNIESNILSNGDLNICEYTQLTGSFNGYVRDIFYKSGNSLYAPKGISNIKVYDLNTNTFSKGNEFVFDRNAYKGDTLKYYYDTTYNGVSVTIFNANSRGNKGYLKIL